MGERTLSYIPGLDGLRAVAMLAVLGYHAFAPFAVSGYLGVDLFFVLSGFLITTILATEHKKTGRIDVLRFYWRRALRLYPTLLLMLVCFLAVAPYLWPEIPAKRYALWAALYVSDYTRALMGEPIVLSYTWSLSVEEHFYLLLPLFLPAILNTKSPIRTLALAYAVATAWRVANYVWLGWDATYFRFDTRLSGLILGCIIALWRPTHLKLAGIAAAVFALLVMIPSSHFWTGLTLAVPFAEISAAILIASCAFEPTRVRWASTPALAYLGRLSYGVYIWHFPAIYWLRENYAWPVAMISAGIFAVGMAAITYHFVDLPLRRLRGVRRTLPAAP